jgi:hypothetical protein
VAVVLVTDQKIVRVAVGVPDEVVKGINSGERAFDIVELNLA